MVIKSGNNTAMSDVCGKTVPDKSSHNV